MRKGPLAERLKLSKSFEEIVREEAAPFTKKRLTKGEVYNILWNHTGYPSFWHGEPEACLRKQLKGFFSKKKAA